MKILACILSIFLASCAQWKHETPSVIYSDSFQERWKVETLKKCRQDSATILMALFEANPKMTKEEVIRMEKFIMDSCSKHFKLFI